MSLPSAGESAAILPWIWPDAGSLVHLCHSPMIPWSDLKDDPGMVLLLLAHHDPLAVNFSTEHVSSAVFHHAIEQCYDHLVPWIDWRHRTVSTIYRTSIATCQIAELLAEYLGNCDPVAAWCGGLLANVGWLSIGVQDSEAVADYLTAKNFATDPWGAQLHAWGMSRCDIAWRLATNWKLPNWAKICLGGISYSPADADRVGGLASLHAIVQTAISLAEQLETPLGLSEEFDVVEAHSLLNLRSSDLETIRARYLHTAANQRLYHREWQHPLVIPALTRELEKAANRIERRDQSRETLLFPTPQQETDGHAAKMEALAEFSAGASHEINNPLAVISAHSQYLLKQSPTDSARKSLETIIRQTERVHTILRDLMMFARPPAPKFAYCSLNQITQNAVDQIAWLAEEKSVQIELAVPGNVIELDVDDEQITRILVSLIRNGIEAAGPNGIVRVKLQQRPQSIEFIIEDTGSGLDERAREHLFDPFFSGRSAGRGRGLGLPTAWKLAQQHGGDVRHVPIPNGLTRFVFSLPLDIPEAIPARKSA